MVMEFVNQEQKCFTKSDDFNNYSLPEPDYQYFCPPKDYNVDQMYVPQYCSLSPVSYPIPPTDSYQVQYQSPPTPSYSPSYSPQKYTYQQSYIPQPTEQYQNQYYQPTELRFFDEKSAPFSVEKQILDYEENLASNVPTFNQCMAGKLLPKKLPQRQPSEKLMLLSLNQEKYRRWKPAIDFLKNYLGDIPIFSYIYELLEQSEKSNKYVQWLTETTTMKYSRAFEFKNTQELIDNFNHKYGQNLSYKSFANLLSLKKWAVYGTVVIQKIGKNQRNKYVLLPDLGKSDFGGKGLSKIDFNSAGEVTETISM